MNLDAAHLGRASQFAIAAARLALVDAGVQVDKLNLARAGVSLGTTSGEPQEVERFDDSLRKSEPQSCWSGVCLAISVSRNPAACGKAN